MTKPTYKKRIQVDNHNLKVKLNGEDYTDFTMIAVGNDKFVIVRHEGLYDTVEVEYV